MADFVEPGAPISIQEWNGEVIAKTAPQVPSAGPGQTEVLINVIGNVPKNDILESTPYVPASGKKLITDNINGALFPASAPTADYYGTLTWDGTIIAYVSGTTIYRPFKKTLIGDGIKELILTIHNDTSTDIPRDLQCLAFEEDV